MFTFHWEDGDSFVVVFFYMYIYIYVETHHYYIYTHTHTKGKTSGNILSKQIKGFVHKMTNCFPYLAVRICYYHVPVMSHSLLSVQNIICDHHYCGDHFSKWRKWRMRMSSISGNNILWDWHSLMYKKKECLHQRSTANSISRYTRICLKWKNEDT